MKPIRMGIIGCGGMAGSHITGLLGLRDAMEVTAVCDIDEASVRRAAEKIGARVAVTDYRQLDEHVDAVLISLPHHLHYEAGRHFLSAGKHVLMEKPLCNTEQQCLDLVELAERSGVLLMTAYPVRYWPVILKMKQLVDDKVYGDVFQMSVWTEQLTIRPEGHWIRSAEELGGGQFFSHGCHYVDLLLAFLGDPLRGCHVGTRVGTPWVEAEGTSNVVMEFANGALGYHFGTWGARGTRLGWSLHIHCTKGMLEYKRSEGKLYLHSQMKEEKSDLNTESESRVIYEDHEHGKKTQYEIEHFLDCIRTGAKPLTDGYDSLQGLRVIWRLYEAERKGVMADLSGLSLRNGSLPPVRG